MAKKVTKEEQQALDAQRALEDQLRQEQEAKEKEQQKRFEIFNLSTGLSLQITQKLVEETWDHDHPKEHITEFLQIIFKKNEWNIRQNLLEIIAEFHLYNLIFTKSNLNLDNYKATVMINILWDLYRNNNNIFGGSEVKNSNSDFQFVSKLLLDHSYEKQPSQKKIFDNKQVIETIKYLKQGYFNHLKLLNYVQDHTQGENDLEFTVYIDIPRQIKPLEDAHFIGKPMNQNQKNVQSQVKVQFQEEQNEDNKQEQEDTKQQVEEDEGEALDPEIIRLVKIKLEEQESKFSSQLQERQQLFEEKLEKAKTQNTKGKKAK